MRLGIVSALAANSSLTFNDLKKLLRTTDGNLSVHARKLEEAGYIACTKSFEGRMPKTEYALTGAGPQGAGEIPESHGSPDSGAMKRMNAGAALACTPPSSWTETAAGPIAAVCLAPPDIAPEPPPCAAPSKPRPDLGISTLTLYAFSEDNWSRPAREVSALMKLLGRYLTQEASRCIANGVRLEAIGRRDRLPAPLVALLEEAERKTAQARACICAWLSITRRAKRFSTPPPAH